MLIMLLVIVAILTPLAAVTLAASFGPPWLIWLALAFALLLLYVTVAQQWWKGQSPPLRWVIVPLALTFLPMCVVALVVRGTAHWILWPIVLGAVLFLVVSLTRDGTRVRT